MSDDAPLVSVKEAVESLLAERIAADPGFLAELAIDPDGVVKPLVTQVIGDDGSMDLSEVAISVHFETDSRLHIVVPVQQMAEVAGFALRGPGGLRGMQVHMPSMGGPLSDMSSQSGVCVCASEDCETEVCCDLTNTCK